MYTSASGSAYSSGSYGTENYPNNAFCELIIAPTGASYIILTFEAGFLTQKNADFVRVSQCTSANCSDSLQLAELSGAYSTPQIISSSTGFVNLTFTSDSRVTAPGYSVSWVSVRLVYVCTVLLCNFIRINAALSLYYFFI
jgi:hypothetical protein